MAKGYWVAHVTVTDAEHYENYKLGARPAFQKYGAKFLVRGGSHEFPEGPGRERHVVIEFESYADALACYRSPEYQAAMQHRLAHAQSEIVIVEGVD
ncbi:MAG: DUF1330 domain-containing protein [Pseudomonadota bacterium]